MINKNTHVPNLTIKVILPTPPPQTFQMVAAKSLIFDSFFHRGFNGGPIFFGRGMGDFENKIFDIQLARKDGKPFGKNPND